MMHKPEPTSSTIPKTEVDIKVSRFEQKISLEMKPQLVAVLKKRDKIYEELSNYL